MESIGQLAAGIAHEINTPAQFVGDNTRFIKDAFDDLIGLNNGYGKLLEAVKNNKATEALIEEIDAAYKKADPEYLAEEIPLAIEQSLDGITRISKIVRAMKGFFIPVARTWRQSISTSRSQTPLPWLPTSGNISRTWKPSLPRISRVWNCFHRKLTRSFST